ncbi:MAG: NADH:flavin oxidoreductase [Desulfobacterales bacterium]|nr:NADH:flavin oxidoreductase [Desulfobacterales bacterium]
MTDLFEPTVLNGMTLANRFVRSATWEGLATAEGFATEGLARLLVDLARGNVGLIITGHAYVSPEGQAAPGQLGITTDGHVPSLKEMVGKIHEAGGKIAVQVSHGGRYALKFPDVVRLGPSTIESRGKIQCREMTVEELRRITGQFAEAGRRAMAAGFDAVQLHAAHGYLLSEFLSPFFNQRTDAYGGSVGNRARFLLEVVDAVRREVGSAFPVLVKLNSQEFLEGGYTVEDMLEVASLLEKASVDAIEMSGGNHVEGIFGKFFPARTGKPKGEEVPYYLGEARRYNEKIRVPLMLVGGIRSYEWARRILSEGYAGYISLSRPLIREPGLINRWKSGDTARSACVSDNGCFKPALNGEGVFCTVAAQKGERDQRKG